MALVSCCGYEKCFKCANFITHAISLARTVMQQLCIMVITYKDHWKIAMHRSRKPPSSAADCVCSMQSDP